MLNGTIQPNPYSSPSHFRIFICSEINRLELSSGLGELEGNVAASEATVDLGVGVDAVVDASALLLVKDDLEELAAVLLGADTLADNLDGVAEIGQDGVVDGGQSAGAGTLLLLVVARAGSTLGAGENAARSEDQDVAVRELLLELAGQTGGDCQNGCSSSIFWRV